MDSAYDAPQIHSFSKNLGHKPIIDHNPRRGEKIYQDIYLNKSEKQRVIERQMDNYGQIMNF